MTVERVTDISLVDAFDRVLDKGIVIDAWMRVSVVGIEILTVDAHVIVASIETYMTKHADVAGTVSRIPLSIAGRAGAAPKIDAESLAAQTVQAALRAWNAHDPRRYAALLDESYIGETHAVPMPLRGRDAARRAMRMKLKVFPDLRFELQDVITLGESAFVSWVATGTRGHERLRVPGCTVGDVRHGRIAHTWCYWDTKEMLPPLRVISRRASHGPADLHRLDTTP